MKAGGGENEGGKVRRPAGRSSLIEEHEELKGELLEEHRKRCLAFHLRCAIDGAAKILEESLPDFVFGNFRTHLRLLRMFSPLLARVRPAGKNRSTFDGLIRLAIAMSPIRVIRDSMLRFLHPFVLALAFVLILSACGMNGPKLSVSEDLARDLPLPREYQGSYRSKGSSEQSSVDLIWDRFDVEGPKVTSFGYAHYVTPGGRQTMVKARAVFFPESGEIEIWESEPSQSSFTTSGSYRGKISPDLRAIEAVWSTIPGGRAGHLALNAR